MASVVLSGLSKSYGNVRVLSDVSVRIDDGDFAVIVGPSGCGKSTLLRVIAGLEAHQAGTTSIAGETVDDVPPAERGVGMLFQSYALFPHLTVERNISFGMRMRGESKDVIATKVAEAARILKLEPYLKRLPKHLSGGQRQRVAIGRSIVREPKVFLFDEPLSNLDAELRVEMRLEIAKLHRSLGATIIYVTHDQVEAMTLGTKIVILDGGVVQQAGTPLEVYYEPANKFVGGFIGSPRMHFLPGRVVEASGSSVVVEVLDCKPSRFSIPCSGAGLSPGDAVEVGIRPEDLAVRENPGSVALSCQTSAVEYMGHASYWYGITEVERLPVVAHLGRDVHIGLDEAVTFFLDPKDIYLFNASGRALKRLGIVNKNLDVQRERFAVGERSH